MVHHPLLTPSPSGHTVVQREVRKVSLQVKVRKFEKAKKTFWGIWTHDLRDTGAMLYRLIHEASPEAEVRVQFISVIRTIKLAFRN